MQQVPFIDCSSLGIVRRILSRRDKEIQFLHPERAQQFDRAMHTGRGSLLDGREIDGI